MPNFAYNLYIFLVLDSGALKKWVVHYKVFSSSLKLTEIDRFLICTQCQSQIFGWLTIMTENSLNFWIFPAQGQGQRIRKEKISQLKQIFRLYRFNLAGNALAFVGRKTEGDLYNFAYNFWDNLCFLIILCAECFRSRSGHWHVL